MSQFFSTLSDIKIIHQKYNFKKKLASGGFCSVFKATERKSNLPVAIKFMKAANASDKNTSRQSAMLKQEMMLYKKLNHPVIVSVLESGRITNGFLFIVMEFIEGFTLSHLFKRQGALSIKSALRIATQVLEGLVAAHEKKIIHRDLNPDNIMIFSNEYPEKVKIINFRISTFLPDRKKYHTKLTPKRMFSVADTYSSPEQLLGEPVTIKSDLYSWGMLLIDLLTAKPPYNIDCVTGIGHWQLSSQPFPIPHSIIDHPLGVILKSVLEKNVSRRCGNSNHLLDRLKEVRAESVPDQNGFLPDRSITFN